MMEDRERRERIINLAFPETLGGTLADGGWLPG
jgi:hypothetical protein